MKNTNLHKLSDKVRDFYYVMDEHTRNVKCAGHWWDHIVRVVNNAIDVLGGQIVGRQSEIIIAAALCHELSYIEDKDNHTTLSSKKCAEFMLDVGYVLSDAQEAASIVLAADRDVKMARTHPERTLYVADKLDLMGIDGTIRLLVEHGNEGCTVRHELADFVAKRQKNWLEYMLSLNVANDLVRLRYSEAEKLLETLRVPKLKL
jgi:HD superfamily phosphodiesterase